VSRREVLGCAVAWPIGRILAGARPRAAQAGGLDARAFLDAPATVVPLGDADVSSVEIAREWSGPLCRSRLTNRGARPARVKQVVLFEVAAALPAAARLYGEGFQMLSQTGGTVGNPIDYASYTDAKHYRMPASLEGRAYYGLLTLTPPAGATRLLAFTSCRRFSGFFRPHGATLQVIVDTEGLEIAPGETWTLEEFTFRSGADRERLLADLAARLVANHPPLRVPRPPTGWCSWYCFGPRVTAQQVLDNLDTIASTIPGLTYVQIDDGYQPAMGDWLETGAAFGGDVQGVLKQIRARGFQPAIWVAPFIAEEGSRLFQQHPGWFVKDDAGAPLRADRVTFGGWRRGPWYALDGTHPEVQQHFERLFRTMREAWGCTYFKLDANFWGAIHGGRFHDPRATRIEAYRRGMEAIVRGAGDSFVLGCNHPIWPSLGVIHGSRSSNDIRRTWDRIASTARQNLSRNWQNGRLWWNDPDAIVLSGELPEHEFLFHATAIYASGGMVLSGDDLTQLPAARMAMLRKLLPPTGVAAAFVDESLRVGWVALPRARMACLFNWTDAPQSLTVRLPRPARVTDFWSGEALGRLTAIELTDMPPRSARLLACEA
jgi:alpha-galactosidase